MDADKLDELERLLAEHERLHDDIANHAEGSPNAVEAAWKAHDARIELQRALLAYSPELVAMARRVAELEGALADMADCQPLPKIYRYTGTAEVDVENMFDVGHRHVSGRKPYDYLKSWLSMLRPFAYATQDDSWGEMEKLLSIVMNNYVQTLVKAEAARAALQTKGPTT
jgi:hypothetical protein